MERIEGAVRDDDLYEALSSDHGIGRTEVARLIGVLMRDGTIYSPRPGYYKRTS
jgi:DNA replicative helicase MCM subunit Mcm2 (Cdc46/Mcm family)